MSDKNTIELDAFYSRVKKTAKASSLKLGDIFLKTGINKSSYDSYRRCGNFPRADEAYRIAKELGVTVEFLLTGKEPPKAPACSNKTLVVSSNLQDQQEVDLLYNFKTLQEKTTKITAIKALKLLKEYENEWLKA